MILSESENRESGAEVQQETMRETFLKAMHLSIVGKSGHWLYRTLNIEPRRHLFGRIDPDDSKAYLFASPEFQAALIQTLSSPGEARDLLLKELKEDRKKRRPVTVGDSYRVDYRNESLTGILAAAIESECGVDLVKAILDTGYDPNTLCDRRFGHENTPYKRKSSVEAAIHRGHEDILKELIDRGAKVGVDALQLAIDVGSPECIDTLLDSGIVNVKVSENVSSEQGGRGGWSARSSNRYCPILVYAAKCGDLATVEKLVHQGADINARSWNGDAISLFGTSCSDEDVELKGEDLRKIIELGGSVSKQASLRIVRNGDVEALRLISEAKMWPTVKELTVELFQATSWKDARRLIEAGAPLKTKWRYAHPKDRVQGRYENSVTTMQWLSDAFGPAPVDMLLPPVRKTPPQTHLPPGDEALVRRLAWERIARTDPASAANDPLCPYPALAWKFLLEAGDPSLGHVFKPDFFKTEEARERMDKALTTLASNHPIDLHKRFNVGCEHNVSVSAEGVGERILCGQWSTEAALSAFKACGGDVVPAKTGTWHGVVATRGPIRAEVEDARSARLVALDALGLSPSEEDITIARKDSLRGVLGALREARRAQAATSAPSKPPKRKSAV